MVKGLWGYVLPFRHNTGVWRTDFLPRHSPRYAHGSRGNNMKQLNSTKLPGVLFQSNFKMDMHV